MSCGPDTFDNYLVFINWKHSHTCFMHLNLVNLALFFDPFGSLNFLSKRFFLSLTKLRWHVWQVTYSILYLIGSIRTLYFLYSNLVNMALFFDSLWIFQLFEQPFFLSLKKLRFTMFDINVYAICKPFFWMNLEFCHKIPNPNSLLFESRIETHWTFLTIKLQPTNSLT